MNFKAGIKADDFASITIYKNNIFRNCIIFLLKCNKASFW